jgi:hypothetical protein
MAQSPAESAGKMVPPITSFVRDLTYYANWLSGLEDSELNSLDAFECQSIASGLALILRAASITGVVGWREPDLDLRLQVIVNTYYAAPGVAAPIPPAGDVHMRNVPPAGRPPPPRRPAMPPCGARPLPRPPGGRGLARAPVTRGPPPAVFFFFFLF